MINEDNKLTITVQEAAQAGKVTPHTLYGWIKDGKLKGEKTGNKLYIDRQSLEAHLATRKASQAASDTQTEPQEEIAANGNCGQPTDTPVPGPNKFSMPTEVQAKLASISKPATQTAVPDLHARADLPAKNAPTATPSPRNTPVATPERATEVAVQQGSPQRQESKPPASAAKGQPANGKALDRKKQINASRRDVRRKCKKGPVRFAKDAMRHLDLAQMIDVREWLLRRMDAKTRPA